MGENISENNHVITQHMQPGEHNIAEHSHGQKHQHSHQKEQNSENGHSHPHSHQHPHKETKAVLNRMSRLIGHLESIKRMVEDGRDCSEVLIQIAAVRSALDGVSRIILKDHIDHCIKEAVMENDMETIENLKNAIDKFI